MVEGGAALGMGIYRGFTGLVTKPVEGAKSKGVGGTYTADFTVMSRSDTSVRLLDGCKHTMCFCCVRSTKQVYTVNLGIKL